MKQDQWEALAMRLVIHLEATNLRVAALAAVIHGL